MLKLGYIVKYKYVTKPKKPTTIPECRYVFEIPIMGTIYDIAISTFGDSLKELQKNHKFFEKHNPKVMVTASHAHNGYEHNLFIENYVFNEIDSANDVIQKRGRYNYIKIESKVGKTLEEITTINTTTADILYSIIIETLKL